MRILLTGGTGFVGRRVIAALLARGDDVAALVRPESRPTVEGVRPVVHDGTTQHMVRIIAAERPAVVVHLASTFLVNHVPDDVDALIDSNVRLGLQLLEAMRMAGVRRMVWAGTFWQHCESDAYRPVNLYAATKQAFEDIAAYYIDAEAFAISHLRLFDVYGPGDERPKLMQYLVKCARSDAPLDMTPGEQLLDLVHVDDVAAAFVRAIDRQWAGEAAGGEVFAVSSGRRLTLRELVALLSQINGRPLPVRFGGRPYRPREIMQPWQGAPPVPGWLPHVALEDGLRGMLDAHV